MEAFCGEFGLPGLVVGGLAGGGGVVAFCEERADVEVSVVFAVGRRGEEVAGCSSCIVEEVVFVGVAVADDAEVEMVTGWSVGDKCGDVCGARERRVIDRWI